MRSLPSHPRALALLALTLAGGLALAGCGGAGQTGSNAPAEPKGKASLADVSSTAELRARFNRDAGVPRLLLLLSPT